MSKKTVFFIASFALSIPNITFGASTPSLEELIPSIRKQLEANAAPYYQADAENAENSRGNIKLLTRFNTAANSLGCLFESDHKTQKLTNAVSAALNKFEVEFIWGNEGRVLTQDLFTAIETFINTARKQIAPIERVFYIEERISDFARFSAICAAILHKKPIFQKTLNTEHHLEKQKLSFEAMRTSQKRLKSFDELMINMELFRAQFVRLCALQRDNKDLARQFDMVEKLYGKISSAFYNFQYRNPTVFSIAV